MATSYLMKMKEFTNSIKLQKILFKVLKLCVLIDFRMAPFIIYNKRYTESLK